MGLPLYLVLSREEWSGATSLPPCWGWLGCHFSSAGSGLEGLPPVPVPLLVLDDRIPPRDQDGGEYCSVLQQLAAEKRFDALLLDFQRPGLPRDQLLAQQLVQALSCPVGVSEAYAAALPCPVFLPPLPLRRRLQEHLLPWQGREIWLDTAPQPETVTVTDAGAVCEPGSVPAQGPELQDDELHCHYQTEILEDRAVFHLRRSREDIHSLLDEAGRLGVRRAVGLWQELS